MKASQAASEVEFLLNALLSSTNGKWTSTETANWALAMELEESGVQRSELVTA
jgi:hypothetical protein